MMRGDSHADHDDCYSGGRNKPSQAKPVSRPLETSRFLADLSYHVPGEEWRKGGSGNTAENVPQLLVIFRFHSLQSIELFAASEVALESGAKDSHYIPGASRKPSSCRIRVGCRILRRAFASI